jgi:hypothetical protein
MQYNKCCLCKKSIPETSEKFTLCADCVEIKEQYAWIVDEVYDDQAV